MCVRVCWTNLGFSVGYATNLGFSVGYATNLGFSVGVRIMYHIRMYLVSAGRNHIM